MLLLSPEERGGPELPALWWPFVTCITPMEGLGHLQPLRREVSAALLPVLVLSNLLFAGKRVLCPVSSNGRRKAGEAVLAVQMAPV